MQSSEISKSHLELLERRYCPDKAPAVWCQERLIFDSIPQATSARYLELKLKTKVALLPEPTIRVVTLGTN